MASVAPLITVLSGKNTRNGAFLKGSPAHDLAASAPRRSTGAKRPPAPRPPAGAPRPAVHSPGRATSHAPVSSAGSTGSYPWYGRPASQWVGPCHRDQRAYPLRTHPIHPAPPPPLTFGRGGGCWSGPHTLGLPVLPEV